MNSTENHVADSPNLEKGVVESDGPGELRNADGSSIKSGEDLLELQDLDPALNMKMHLVNNVGNTQSCTAGQCPAPDTDFRQLTRLDGLLII
jgi:hypothetical protein